MQLVRLEQRGQQELILLFLVQLELQARQVQLGQLVLLVVQLFLLVIGLPRLLMILLTKSRTTVRAILVLMHILLVLILTSQVSVLTGNFIGNWRLKKVRQVQLDQLEPQDLQDLQERLVTLVLLGLSERRVLLVLRGHRVMLAL